jgi:3-deoxy-manno-octulosonate cytidylyltransferase (CMP-KDO synthetase)
LLGDKPIIEWVYRSASQFFDRVVVATDDRRIADVVEAFGGEALMTSNKHRCGTERCAEALSLLDEEYDVVANIQGDEPFITVGQMQTLIEQFRNPWVDIATLATPIDGRGERVDDPNIVKVVISQRDTALYFSRSVIPYLRGVEPKDWTSNHT